MEDNYKENQKLLDELYIRLKEETTECGLDVVQEIVDLEIRQEKFCNN